VKVHVSDISTAKGLHESPYGETSVGETKPLVGAVLSAMR
jgi:hypothetical protein